jgi:hypothetical protein
MCWQAVVTKYRYSKTMNPVIAYTTVHPQITS